MIKIRLADKNNGNPKVNWKGVAAAYTSIVAVMSLTCVAIHVFFKAVVGYSLFGINGWMMLGFALAIMPSLMLGVWVRVALARSTEELNELNLRKT